VTNSMPMQIFPFSFSIRAIEKGSFSAVANESGMANLLQQTNLALKLRSEPNLSPHSRAIALTEAGRALYESLL